MKYIFILLFALGLLGCGASKKMIGTYYSPKLERSLTNHTLELKADSTFNYHLEGGLLNQRSKGTWSIINSGELILNSDESFKPGIVDIIEEYRSHDNLKIEVADELNNPLSYAAIILNDDEMNFGFNLNENGQGEYSDLLLETIQVNYLGEKYHQKVSNVDVNHVVLKIRLKDNASIYFQNDIWKVQGSKLKDMNNLVLIK